jgi:hypothetical protein
VKGAGLPERKTEHTTLSRYPVSYEVAAPVVCETNHNRFSQFPACQRANHHTGDTIDQCADFAVGFRAKGRLKTEIPATVAHEPNFSLVSNFGEGHHNSNAVQADLVPRNDR